MIVIIIYFFTLYIGSIWGFLWPSSIINRSKFYTSNVVELMKYSHVKDFQLSYSKQDILSSGLTASQIPTKQAEQYKSFGVVELPSDPTATLSAFKLETDYLGMINFCLRSTDTALSSTSKSKILNQITNKVFRVIVIGYEPFIQDTLSKFVK